MTTLFQTLFGPTPNGIFDVTMTDITATQIREPNGKPAPSTIIHTNQPFSIDVRWHVSGSLWGEIGGKWHLHAYLEHMGVGPDLDLTDPEDHLIPFTYSGPPEHYHKMFDVPAGIVAHEGAYKLVVTLTYINLADLPGDMAGYWEGPILQFYP